MRYSGDTTCEWKLAAGAGKWNGSGCGEYKFGIFGVFYK